MKCNNNNVYYLSNIFNIYRYLFSLSLDEEKTKQIVPYDMILYIEQNLNFELLILYSCFNKCFFEDQFLLVDNKINLIRQFYCFLAKN